MVFIIVYKSSHNQDHATSPDLPNDVKILSALFFAFIYVDSVNSDEKSTWKQGLGPWKIPSTHTHLDAILR